MAAGSSGVEGGKSTDKSVSYVRRKAKVLSLSFIPEREELGIPEKFLEPTIPKIVEHYEPEDINYLVPIDTNMLWNFTLSYYRSEQCAFKYSGMISDDFSKACEKREFLRNKPAHKISQKAQSMTYKVFMKIKDIQAKDAENFNRCFSDIINILLSRYDVYQLLDCRSCLNDPTMAALFTEKQAARLSLAAEKQAIIEAARQAEEAKALAVFKSELQVVTNNYNGYYDKLLELILINVNAAQAAKKHEDAALLDAINTLTDLHAAIISHIVRYGRGSYMHAKASARVLDAVLFGTTERLLKSKDAIDQVPKLAHHLASQMVIIFGAEQLSKFQEQAKALKGDLAF